MDWNDLALNRDMWRALVNLVMNLWLPLNRGITGLAEDLLVSREGLCPMELVL
jgi:hypothetical protein